MKKRNWILSGLMTVVLVANVAVCFGGVGDDEPVDFIIDSWPPDPTEMVMVSFNCHRFNAWEQGYMCDLKGRGCSVLRQRDCSYYK